ncbi:hypothetical protein E2C01_062752 [Portunus trituberculatus]|uniref:Uncharacterized protein n=1 Tax=Portunus trituberculatus TaxID=210409 RepID=A0A5B7H8S0_PORTR|nr:hypothetical protein [Portunus trituberculatus]
MCTWWRTTRWVRAPPARRPW